MSDAMAAGLMGSGKGKNSLSKKEKLAAELAKLNEEITLNEDIKKLEGQIAEAKLKLKGRH